MPTYTVIITRDITESTAVEVEAASAEEAEDAALTKLHQSTNTEWAIDEGSWNNGDHYVTDVAAK